MTRAAPLLPVLAALGCAVPRPASPAAAYAHALDAGQLDAAYALTTPAFRAGTSEADFRARLADPVARAARALAVRDGLGALARAAPELFEAAPAAFPGGVVIRFSAAVRAGRFDQAQACLAAGLRARYTPELLARDYRAEPAASARLERALVAVEGVPVQAGDSVRFPVGGGGSVVLRREPDGWRIESLE